MSKNGFLNFHVNTDDYSLDVEDFQVDKSIGVFQDSDYMYIGYRKPISRIYMGLSTANTETSEIAFQYFNGSIFGGVSNLIDETRGLGQSGFISWNRNQVNETATTVNTIEAYWYRLSVDVTTSALTLSGVNLLLSEDSDFRGTNNFLLSSNYYPTGETSWLGAHQESRDEIIQRLRNKGYGVKSENTFNDLTIFDLLDPTQLHTASKYLALSKAYFFLSDNSDDKYYQKYKDYQKLYKDAFDTFFLSLDTNDDGKKSETEEANFSSGLIIRV